MSDKRTDTARALIGQCLWDNTKVNDTLVARVSPLDMPAHWGKVWAMVKAGATDVQRIAMALDVDALNSIGGEIGIAELSIYGGGDHAGEYARALLQYTARVRLLDVAEKIKQATLVVDSDPDAIVNKSIDDLAQLAIGGQQEIFSLAEIFGENMAEIETARENPRDVWGLRTGFDKFDYLTGGLQQGELIMLTGEPGVGKTWLALQVAATVARAAPVFFASMEMGRLAVGRRILSGMSGVSSRAMKTGKVDSSQLAGLRSFVDSAKDLPLHITDDSFTLPEFRAAVARAKQKYGVKMVGVDYMMLFDGRWQDDTAMTAEASRTLKMISKDLDVAVFCLHSVTKSSMDEDGGRPKLSGMRGSGQTPHDIDVGLMLTPFKPLDDRERLATHGQADKMVSLWVTKGRELESSKKRIGLVRKEGSPFFGEVDLGR